MGHMVEKSKHSRPITANSSMRRVFFNVCHNEAQLKNIQRRNHEGDESSNIGSLRLLYYPPLMGYRRDW